MDLTKPSELKRLLNAHGLHLSKRFGQHFLVDRVHLARVVETADIGPDDAVFEIGPGVGTLTVELARRARKVLSVELDRGIVPVLREVTAAFPNVDVVEGDALALGLPRALEDHLGPPRYKVAANIPYNITSPILVRLLENKRLFSGITLMVQKEVADRLSALPATPDYGSLTVFAQYHAAIRTVAVVPRGAFHPPPRVDSAIIHLIPHASAPIRVASETAFFGVSRAAFGQRRKTLLNALSNAPGLSFSRDEIVGALGFAGIDGQRRGETLSLQEIGRIADRLPFDKVSEPPV